MDRQVHPLHFLTLKDTEKRKNIINLRRHLKNESLPNLPQILGIVPPKDILVPYGFGFFFHDGPKWPKMAFFKKTFFSSKK